MKTNFSTAGAASVGGLSALDATASANHPYHPNAQAARTPQSRSLVDLTSSAHGSLQSGIGSREHSGQQTSTSPRLGHVSEIDGGIRDLHLNGTEPRIFPGVLSRPPRKSSMVSRDGSKHSSGHEVDGDAKRRSALMGGMDVGVVEEEATTDAEAEEAGGG